MEKTTDYRCKRLIIRREELSAVQMLQLKTNKTRMLSEDESNRSEDNYTCHISEADENFDTESSYGFRRKVDSEVESAENDPDPEKRTMKAASSRKWHGG